MATWADSSVVAVGDIGALDDRQPGGTALAERIILQIGHRITSLGLLVWLGAAVAAYLERLESVWQLPGIAFVCADIGIVCAAGASMLASHRRGRRGQAIGLFLFASLLALGSGWMVMILRLGWTRS